MNRQQTTFADLQPGDRFRQGDRELMKLEPLHETQLLHLAADSQGGLHAFALTDHDDPATREVSQWMDLA